MAWNRIDQQPEILSCDLNFLLLENVPQKIPGCGNLTTSKVPFKKDQSILQIPAKLNTQALQFQNMVKKI